MAYSGPTIDHSVLSPNGRVSKRARAAKMAIEHAKLFEGVELAPPPAPPTKADRLARLQRELINLRARAAAGERARYHTRQADLCERLIAQLKAEAA